MNPRDFQDAATFLLAHGPAYNRSAISRAYYATFHVALTHLIAAGFSFKKNDSRHVEVSRHLQWCRVEAVRAVGSELSDFRSVRNKADYDLDLSDFDTDKTAQLWVRAAQNHIRDLDSAFGGNQKDQIISSIRENWRKVYGKA
jgi:uncharacterized protein (UPF0332 family)